MKKELLTLAIGDIHPYAKNPRKNDAAIPDVKESIIQAGYVAPIIVDENNEILAGHTRFEAIKELGKTEVEVMQVTGMTEEQKKKYRILDNKTGEKATWDFELLEWELQELDFEGYDFGFDMPNEYESQIDEISDDSGKTENQYHIVYELVFNNEDEQKCWYEFIKELKAKMPEYDTISERIMTVVDDWMAENA